MRRVYDLHYNEATAPLATPKQQHYVHASSVGDSAPNLFVNNRLEGNAPGTIEAVVDEL